MIIVTFLCCVAGCCNIDDMSYKTERKYEGEGFSLRLPKDVRVKKRTPVEDFSLYTFVYSNKTLLSAYVGNQPNFPKLDDATKTENGLVNDLHFERVLIKDTDGTPQTHVLVKFSDSQDWPMYMHFWYSDLSPKEQETAEAIISSVKVK